MSKDEIVARLTRLQAELADPKWNTWVYTEGSQMYKDLQDHIVTLGIVITELNKE